MREPHWGTASDGLRPFGRRGGVAVTGHFRSFEERAEICPNRTIDPISRAPATPNAVIGARNVD
jgi:hypothetical protein